MFTSKLPVSRAVLPEYPKKFKEKVISCCKDIRDIMFRCQLFVNAYLVHNKKNDFPSRVFTQQFWYSIGQLATGKKVTHKTAVNDSIKTFFEDFQQEYSAVVISNKFTKGYSQCLTEAAQETSVAYNKSIVELFEQRMLKYLTYKLQNLFVKADAEEVAESYCYQKICKSELEWPEKIELSSLDKSKIETLCNSFDKLVTEKVTLLSLATDPANFAKPLWYILSVYEQEHAEHAPYDLHRLPLPRRFFPFPTPSTR
ncbi:hypothetical protein BDF20DRAFT_822963 [Mycotypha africana]|uniref:uncharacterized protein n=1 Tax=Mycotypha africana TaxID=64632 RepID=UPI0022FFE21E|nr:uncharacterized protein BDF20DRAFT_822963 [Mycotypha africana]KAI8975378.1 hypothetical protein BDF20DRAFT_822963 [Mycotypha africana]